MNENEITEVTPEPTTEVIYDNSDLLTAFDTLYQYHAFESTILLFIFVALFILVGCHLGKSLWR